LLTTGGGKDATGPLGQALSGLEDFHGLKPEEIAALQTTLGNAGQSTAKTIQSQLGGVANPNQLIQSLYNQNAQSGLNLGTQLGGMGAAQELSALQSAGQLSEQGILDTLGMQSSAFGQGLGSLGGLTNTYAGLLKGQGNPSAGLGGSLGNILTGAGVGGSKSGGGNVGSNALDSAIGSSNPGWANQNPFGGSGGWQGSPTSSFNDPVYGGGAAPWSPGTGGVTAPNY
jgi:hypothetical protein